MNHNTCSKLIVHVSEVDISESTGMGRVEYNWEKAFIRAGFTFVHIGPAQVGKIKHRYFFAKKSYEYFKSLHVNPAAIIVHEPIASKFLKSGFPVFIESHGLERRYWQIRLSNQINGIDKPNLKSRLLFPFWRLKGCDAGIKKASKLLLINSEDKEFAIQYYKRSEKDIFVFKNGVDLYPEILSTANNQRFTVLFNGSWVIRKGIHTLVQSAKDLLNLGFDIEYILIGTGKSKSEVLIDWPRNLHAHVVNVRNFEPKDELDWIKRADVFLLPSYYEGQPLSLLQAMSGGLCCITTNNCGQKDIVQNGETGLLFKSGSHEELTSLIAHCIENKELRINIGKNAKKAIQNRTWDAVSDELVEFVARSLELTS